MLDVLHFFFEEDYRYSTYEEAQHRESFRNTVYKNLYNVDYEYNFEKEEDKNKENFKDFDQEYPVEEIEVEDPVQPFSPRLKQTKAYVPPTEFNEDSNLPFGDILDQPLG